MAKKPAKIETPGADSEQLTSAQAQVNIIQDKATNITEAIALNQAIIDNPDSLEDEKEQAQLKIDALLAAQEEINSILGSANEALQSVQTKAQMAANSQKKTDMTGITISKQGKPIIKGPNIELTEKGYVVGPRTVKAVKE